MDIVQQGSNIQMKLIQIKQEVEERSNVVLCQEQEQLVSLESLKNQTSEQQKILQNNKRELNLLCEQERNKKLSIEQLDQQILIKTKNIAELGRQEMSQKNQLSELLQKEQSQKRILVQLESQTQKATETWKSNVNILRQKWNRKVAEFNAEEERMLKNLKDIERTMRIEIEQKETVERETNRKECELELVKVKKSIAEGYAKLKKIYKLTKMVQNYRNLHQMAPNPTCHLPIPADQPPPIQPNQPSQSFNPISPDCPVDVEQCVPPTQPLSSPIISIQTIQSGVIPRPPPSALPAQPSQLVGQFCNQQKLQRQQLLVQDELIRSAAAAINANLPNQLPLPPSIAEFDSSFNTTTTTASPSCVIPEMVQSSSSPSESTTSCPVPVNPINIDIDQCPNSSPVNVEQCVPLQPPIKPNQPIHLLLLLRPSPSALPAQPSQLVGQFYNQQKLQQKRIIVQDEPIRRAVLAVNANLPSHLPPPPATADFDSSFNTTTTTTASQTDSTNGSLTSTLASTTDTAVTSTSTPLLAKLLTTTSELASTATSSTLFKSSQQISPVTSTLANSSTTETYFKLTPSRKSILSKYLVTTISPLTSTPTYLPIYTAPSLLAQLLATTSTLVSSATSTLSESSPSLLPITSSSTSTSSSFSANWDKSSSTVAKSVDNGIEIITIDDSDDDDVEEELSNFDDCGTIEDNETSNSINQIQKNFSTIDELIDVNHIGGNDIAPVGTTAAVVKPMDNFENEPTESTDKIIVDLVAETSIQNHDLDSNDYESVDDQFELVDGQNDNQQPKFTSKTNNKRQQKIKTKRLSKLREYRGYYKLRNNKKKKKKKEERQQRLEQSREYCYRRKREPTLLIDDQTTIEPLSPANKKKVSKQKFHNNKSESIEVIAENCSDSEVQIQIEDSKQNNVGRRMTRANSLLKPTTTIEQIVEVPTEQPQQQTPRRRGRKAKLVNDNPANTTTTITTSSSNDNTPNSDQPKKKRGRKPKPKTELQQKPDNKRKCHRKIDERLTMETPAQRERRPVVIYRRRHAEIFTEWKKSIENETQEEREHRLKDLNERQKRWIANETPEERERRLVRYRERLANETPEERERRLAQMREYDKQRMTNETPEERERRLAQMREYDKQKKANETPEQREHRLKDLNERQKRWIANETPEERERRLAQMREYDKQRFANETPEQRKCRMAKDRERYHRDKQKQQHSST